jgi:hypothetical protein
MWNFTIHPLRLHWLLACGINQRGSKTKLRVVPKIGIWNLHKQSSLTHKNMKEKQMLPYQSAKKGRKKKSEHTGNWILSTNGFHYLSAHDYWSQSTSSGSSKNSYPRRNESPLAHASHRHGNGAQRHSWIKKCWKIEWQSQWSCPHSNLFQHGIENVGSET